MSKDLKCVTCEHCAFHNNDVKEEIETFETSSPGNATPTFWGGPTFKGGFCKLSMCAIYDVEECTAHKQKEND